MNRRYSVLIVYCNSGSCIGTILCRTFWNLNALSDDYRNSVGKHYHVHVGRISKTFIRITTRVLEGVIRIRDIVKAPPH